MRPYSKSAGQIPPSFHSPHLDDKEIFGLLWDLIQSISFSLTDLTASVVIKISNLTNYPYY